MVFTNRTPLLKNNIFRTLALYNTGSFQDLVKIALRLLVLLARGRPFGCELGGIHLRPLHLDAGKGHLGTFDAGRPLYSGNPRTSIDEPLHESEIAAGYGLDWPDPDYYILHGQAGHLVQLG